MGKKAKKSSSKKQRPAKSEGIVAVDLHGMTRDEAIARLEQTLDRALLNDCYRLEVIHGHGKGVLKQAVHQFLAKSRHVKRHCIDELNTGTTIAYL